MMSSFHMPGKALPWLAAAEVGVVEEGFDWLVPVVAAVTSNSGS